MSARDMVHMRNGARITATALCQWERAPQGGLRATWRPGWRVAAGTDAGGHDPNAVVQLTRETERLHALSRPGRNRQQRRIDRWIAGGFIAALYLLVALAGVAIVVRA
jgi:hypothetical protein